MAEEEGFDWRPPLQFRRETLMLWVSLETARSIAVAPDSTYQMTSRPSPGSGQTPPLAQAGQLSRSKHARAYGREAIPWLHESPLGSAEEPDLRAVLAFRESTRRRPETNLQIHVGEGLRTLAAPYLRASARAKRHGANSAGQSSSLSRRTKTPPRGRTFSAASSTARSSSPCLFSRLPRGFRIGGRTSSFTLGSISRAILRNKTGAALTSP